MPSSDRTTREAQFHDQRYTQDQRAGAAKYYEADRSFHERYWDLIDRLGPAHPPVLELGCGRSCAVLRPALHHTTRIAIDVSPVAVELARSLGSSATFEVMDCHSLELPDRSQGLVCGSGILHHVDLAAAVPELARVLRPDGRAVFLEPLGHNPAINLYRRLTPRLRTPDEHPLRVSDLDLLRAHFAGVEVEYFGLLAPAVAVAHRLPGSRALARAAQAVDRAVLRIPFMRRFAWMSVIVASGRDAGG